MYIATQTEHRLTLRLDSRLSLLFDFCVGLLISLLLLVFNTFMLMFIIVAIWGSGYSEVRCTPAAPAQADCIITADRSGLLNLTEQQIVQGTHRAAAEVTRRGFAVYLYGQEQEALFTVYESREQAEMIAQALNEFMSASTRDQFYLRNDDEHWLSGFTTRTGGVIMFILVAVSVIYVRRHFNAGGTVAQFVRRLPLFIMQVGLFSVHLGWQLWKRFQTTTCEFNTVAATCTVRRHHVVSEWFVRSQVKQCPLSAAEVRVRPFHQVERIDYRLELVQPQQPELRLVHYHAPLSARQTRQLAIWQTVLAQYVKVRVLT